MLYDTYSNLLGLPYVEGRQDCYGLVRQFYLQVYGINLRNYARPTGFDHNGLDLIVENFPNEGFYVVTDAELQLGDGLLFGVASDKINHVGVYVGNQQILHHLFNDKSRLDPLDPRWYRRLLGRVRHPDVTELNNKNVQKVNLMDFLPPHLKRRLKDV